MSAIIIHQTSPFVIILLAETSLYYSIQLFLLVGIQGLALSSGTGYPRYTTDTHTLVYERCVII